MGDFPVHHGRKHLDLRDSIRIDVEQVLLYLASLSVTPFLSLPSILCRPFRWIVYRIFQSPLLFFIELRKWEFLPLHWDGT